MGTDREAKGNSLRTLTHLPLAGVLVGQLQEAGQVPLNLLHIGTLTQEQPIEVEEEGLGQDRVESRLMLFRNPPILAWQDCVVTHTVTFPKREPFLLPLCGTMHGRSPS